MSLGGDPRSTSDEEHSADQRMPRDLRYLSTNASVRWWSKELWSRFGCDQTGLVGDDDSLDAVSDSELGQDPADVGLHLVLPDDELPGDLDVRQARPRSRRNGDEVRYRSPWSCVSSRQTERGVISCSKTLPPLGYRGTLTRYHSGISALDRPERRVDSRIVATTSWRSTPRRCSGWPQRLTNSDPLSDPNTKAHSPRPGMAAIEQRNRATRSAAPVATRSTTGCRRPHSRSATWANVPAALRNVTLDSEPRIQPSDRRPIRQNGPSFARPNRCPRSRFHTSVTVRVSTTLGTVRLCQGFGGRRVSDDWAYDLDSPVAVAGGKLTMPALHDRISPRHGSVW